MSKHEVQRDVEAFHAELEFHALKAGEFQDQLIVAQQRIRELERVAEAASRLRFDYPRDDPMSRFPALNEALAAAGYGEQKR